MLHVNELFSNELFNELRDIFEQLEKEHEEWNNDAHTYVHFVKEKYENGKCVDHKEKIVEDGVVKKNEHTAKNQSISDKKEDKCKCVENGDEKNSLNKKVDYLEKRCKELEEMNSQLNRKLHDVREEYTKAISENNNLLAQLRDIKKQFNNINF